MTPTKRSGAAGCACDPDVAKSAIRAKGKNALFILCSRARVGFRGTERQGAMRYTAISATWPLRGGTPMYSDFVRLENVEFDASGAVLTWSSEWYRSGPCC